MSLSRLQRVRRLLDEARQAIKDPVSVTFHLMAPEGSACPDHPWADPTGDAKLQVIIRKHCSCAKCTEPREVKCAACGFFFDWASSVSKDGAWICPRCRALPPAGRGDRAGGEAARPNPAAPATPIRPESSTPNANAVRSTDAKN